MNCWQNLGGKQGDLDPKEPYFENFVIIIVIIIINISLFIL